MSFFAIHIFTYYIYIYTQNNSGEKLIQQIAGGESREAEEETMGITCPTRRSGGECWEWARVYINYCICSGRDQLSFGLGMLSVISWGVAEIPQIVTNYKEKSVEGLSLGFLITWIIGYCLFTTFSLLTKYNIYIIFVLLGTFPFSGIFSIFSAVCLNPLL